MFEFHGWATVRVDDRDSYGLLYVHDDEDGAHGLDHSNEFRVWRLAGGRLEEVADPFLSPYLPTVELP